MAFFTWVFFFIKMIQKQAIKHDFFFSFAFNNTIWAKKSLMNIVLTVFRTGMLWEFGVAPSRGITISVPESATVTTHYTRDKFCVRSKKTWNKATPCSLPPYQEVFMRWRERSAKAKRQPLGQNNRLQKMQIINIIQVICNYYAF
jgi:hypothetical protein